jgi:hypothetical protein
MELLLGLVDFRLVGLLAHYDPLPATVQFANGRRADKQAALG